MDKRYKYRYNKSDQQFIHNKIEEWLETIKYNCINCWWINFNVALSDMKDSIICMISFVSENEKLKDFQTTFILKPRFYDYFNFTKKELNYVWNETKKDLINDIKSVFKCLCK